MVVHLFKKDTSQGHQIAGRIHGWTKMGLSLALLNLYIVTLATAQGEVNIRIRYYYTLLIFLVFGDVDFLLVNLR